MGYTGAHDATAHGHPKAVLRRSSLRLKGCEDCHHKPPSVRARPGRLGGLSVFPSKSVMYGCFCVGA
jgi:hypothetical protein